MQGLGLGLGNIIAIATLVSVAFLIVSLSICLFGNKEMMFKNWMTLISSVIFIFGISCAVAINIDAHTYRNYMYQFEVEKQMIEDSMFNEKLSGLERVELVKQATVANKELARYKYDCQQWYGVAIPDDILDIEFINLD